MEDNEIQERAGVIVLDHKSRHLIIKGPTGKWSFPKGRIEPGETSYEAALREALEETGLDLSKETQFVPVQLVRGTYYFFKFDKSYKDIPLTQPTTPDEVLEIAWKKRKSIRKLPKNLDLDFYFRQNYEFRRPRLPPPA